MKILLLGEYSNVHCTLAEGLKRLGHDVTLVSDGDGWKNYPRDINLKRKSLGLIDTAAYLYKIHKLLPKLKDFDIVQIINPIFLDIKAKRIRKYYDQIRKQNHKMVLGAFGMDYYWVKAGLDCNTFKYSDFNIGNALRKSAENDAFIEEWFKGEKGSLNQYIANDCDGIVSGLYEYDVCYRPYFKDKLQFIPFPIKIDETAHFPHQQSSKIRFFIGIQKNKGQYKGTDIMLSALNKIHEDFPDETEIIVAENVPFKEYRTMMDDCDVLLDQLYSYTPAMNGLNAMGRGLILVGGGEPEQYEILNEKTLRPIINVFPDENDVYCKLRKLVEHPEIIPTLKEQSLEYIKKHHEYQSVAIKYVNFYNKIIGL